MKNNQEIIKEFDDKVIDECYKLPSLVCNSQRLTISQQVIIKQFILQALNERTEEIRKEIKEEIWEKHTISYIKDEYNISNELEVKINDMCLNSHNDFLNKLLEFLNKLDK